ncbi:hypothetical protein H311_03881, partial [Anncaliia algerae PRA109]
RDTSKFSISIFFFLIYSFLTFLGIRKKRTSSLILVPSLFFGAFLCMKEHFKEYYDKEKPLVNLLSENLYNNFKEYVLKNEKRILLLIFIFSLILGYSLDGITLLGKILLSLYFSISSMDCGLSIEMKKSLKIHSRMFDYFIGSIIFCLIYYLCSYVFDICLAGIFSLYGSFFLLATFVHLTDDSSLGLENLVKREEGIIIININNSAFALIIFTGLFGFIIQVFVLRKK